MSLLHSYTRHSTSLIRHTISNLRPFGVLAQMTGKVTDKLDEQVPPKVLETSENSEEIANGSNGTVREGHTKWKEIKIPVPWGHISGKWWGGSFPQPVLAIHGWQDNAGTWDNLIPLIPANIPVLAIDLPGHGFSSPISKGQFYFLAWDGPLVVRRIVQHFGWKSVTILGHSLGGIVGFMYSSIFPTEVTKLIQVDIANPSIRAAGTVAQTAANAIDKFLKYEDLTEEDMPCYDYQEMLDIVVDAYHGSVNRESCKVLMRRGMRPSPTGPGFVFSRDVRLKVPGLGFLSHEHVMELASNIRCKLLNIRALPIKSFDKPEYYDEVLERVRKNSEVEYHEIPGTHHLHLNTPEKVADIITKFLTS